MVFYVREKDVDIAFAQDAIDEFKVGLIFVFLVSFFLL